MFSGFGTMADSPVASGGTTKWTPVKLGSGAAMMRTSVVMSREKQDPSVLAAKRVSSSSHAPVELATSPELSLDPNSSLPPPALPSLLPPPPPSPLFLASPSLPPPPEPSSALRVAALPASSHRRSRSAGSMKTILGEASSAPAAAQLRFSAATSPPSELRSSKKEIGSVLSPKPGLKKQQSTLGKFFSSSRSTGMALVSKVASSLDGENDGSSSTELDLQIALADGKKKVMSIKASESWTVKEVLDGFLGKVSSVKLRKFLAVKNVSSSDALGLQVPSELGPVWLRPASSIGFYLDDGSLPLLLVDALPIDGLSPSMTTMFVMLEDGEAKLMNMDETRLIETEVQRCASALGLDDSTSWFFFCCTTGKLSADGFWLDPRHTLADYGLPLCSRLELREPNLVVLSTIKGERLLIDGSSTGESFLRKHLQKLKVIRFL